MNNRIVASALLCLSLACGAKADKLSADTGSCSLGNTYDSHVFAISWQPGFCQTKADKPECRNLSKEGFAKANFTLHGLWPNKTACGTNYDFCGDVKTEASDFCAFPPVPMDSSTSARLDTLMPSAKYGSCLDRHEWWKHGTCRDSSASAYFTLAMGLLSELDSSAFVKGYVARNIGKTVSLSGFNAAFDSVFGEGSHFKIAVNCKSGSLVEIQMNLPKELDRGLSELIAKGGPMRKGSCKKSFRIVDVD